MLHKLRSSRHFSGLSLKNALSHHTLPITFVTALTVGSLGTYVTLQSRSPEATANSTIDSEKIDLEKVDLEKIGSGKIQATKPLQIRTITALGRLEPNGEIIQVTSAMAGTDHRVGVLNVKEGDRVKKGDVIAVLQSHEQLQISLFHAKEQVHVAQSKLAQIKAGSKLSDIAAQRSEVARIDAERAGNLNAQAATIARLEAEVQNAKVEYQRYISLYARGAISASAQEQKQLGLQVAQAQLDEAKATLEKTRLTQQNQLQIAESKLDSIAEVRPVDVQVAEAEVRQAIAFQAQAQMNLDQASIRAPQNGKVLKVYTRPGEMIHQNGIVEIGNTQEMAAIAEVDETDVPFLKTGLRAKVRDDSLSGELTGIVDSIGQKVVRQSVVNLDPSASVDSRVVEVRIKLDSASSATVSSLTNLQVIVTIERDSNQ
jgi:HlyD family secretion protein